MNQEERIRQRAHHIWEEEGCPHGHDHEHWQRACNEVAREEQRNALGGRPGSTSSDLTRVQISGGTNSGPPDLMGADALGTKADRLAAEDNHPAGLLPKRPLL